MRGVTLMELMIVLAIVGILAGIGYPAYVAYGDRARRADGRAALLDAAARMERYYFDRNQYTTALSNLGYASNSPESSEGNYVLSAAAGPTGSINTSFTLTATPNAGTWSDADCGNLTLDSRGDKDRTGAEPVENCWDR